MFAGLTYGWEGGVLTGLWAGALASINIFSFSLHDFEWLLEETFVLLVIGIGIVMALPVERERKQRQRAEAAVGRLQLLNELASVTMQARTPAQAVNASLAHLVGSTSLDDAGFALWRDEGDAPIVAATHQPRSSLTSALESRPTVGEVARTGLAQLPVNTGGFEGWLIVEEVDDAELHARATDVEVVLRSLEGAVELEVQDDGVGFDVPDQPGGYLYAGRLGLMGMHERAQLAGGSLALRSVPGEGTVVHARINLA